MTLPFVSYNHEVWILTNTAMSKMINISCSVSIIWRLNGVARSTIHIKQNISGLVAGTSVGSNRVCTKLRAAAILWTTGGAFINIYKKKTEFSKKLYILIKMLESSIWKKLLNETLSWFLLFQDYFVFSCHYWYFATYYDTVKVFN